MSILLGEDDLSSIEHAAIERIARQYKTNQDDVVVEILRCSTRFRVAVRAERAKWKQEPATKKKQKD